MVKIKANYLSVLFLLSFLIFNNFSLFIEGQEIKRGRIHDFEYQDFENYEVSQISITTAQSVKYLKIKIEKLENQVFNLSFVEQKVMRDDLISALMLELKISSLGEKKFDYNFAMQIPKSEHQSNSKGIEEKYQVQITKIFENQTLEELQAILKGENQLIINSESILPIKESAKKSNSTSVKESNQTTTIIPKHQVKKLKEPVVEISKHALGPEIITVYLGEEATYEDVKTYMANSLGISKENVILKKVGFNHNQFEPSDEEEQEEVKNKIVFFNTLLLKTDESKNKYKDLLAIYQNKTTEDSRINKMGTDIELIPEIFKNSDKIYYFWKKSTKKISKEDNHQLVEDINNRTNEQVENVNNDNKIEPVKEEKSSFKNIFYASLWDYQTLGQAFLGVSMLMFFILFVYRFLKIFINL
ncbi:MAG: hypothetical protein ACLTFB_02470 [Candidatus Phytoplasma pyri]